MHLEIKAKLRQGDFTLRADTLINNNTVGIFGPSGSGKSTLLHILSGLKKPQEGRIVLNGEVLFDSDKNIFLPPHKRNLGVVFQDGRLFPHMTVKKNLLFGMKRNKGDGIDFASVVNVLELGELLGRYAHNLSGGEKQRVAIARALLSNPHMLLLDEPFSAIDYNMRSELLPFINLLHTEFDIPIIIISHDLPDILQFTDYLLLLGKGEITGQGRCNDLAFSDDTCEVIAGCDIRSCFNAEVSAQDNSSGTAMLKACSGSSSPAVIAPYNKSIYPGSTVRAMLSPEDVILSVAPVEYISAQNQLRGVISRIRQTSQGAMVEVDVNGLKLLSEVTGKAARDFPYSVGASVWALFKTHALSYAPCNFEPYEFDNAPALPEKKPATADKCVYC